MPLSHDEIRFRNVNIHIWNCESWTLIGMIDYYVIEKKSELRVSLRFVVELQKKMDMLTIEAFSF